MNSKNIGKEALMTLAKEITELVRTMVKNHPKSFYYRDPQIHPYDMLNCAKTVIVIFISYSNVVYQDIKGNQKTSIIWSDAYMQTNALLNQITLNLQKLLESKGFHGTSEPPTENFDHVTKTASWGHKSNAVIAGIGTFGLNHLIITKQGCLGRLNSLVTDAYIPATKRPDSSYCLYYKNGKCKVCTMNCPSGAISPNGDIDKKRCDAYLEGKNIHDWQQGCAQCSLGPCALKGF